MALRGGGFGMGRRLALNLANSDSESGVGAHCRAVGLTRTAGRDRSSSLTAIAAGSNFWLTLKQSESLSVMRRSGVRVGRGPDPKT